MIRAGAKSPGVPDLAQWIRPGDLVLWGQACAEPLTLTRALVEQRQRLGRLRIFLGIGASDTLQPEHADSFDFLGYCAAGSHRRLAAAGVLDIVPAHYSTLPRLLSEGPLRADVLLLQASPPDEEGRHSLGLAGEYLIPLLDSARVVIVEVNSHVPWVPGERSLTAESADLFVPAAAPPAELPGSTSGNAGPVEQAIGRYVADLVEDGATLQLGIGNIPDAVAGALHGHRDLGLHTGAIGDGAARLAQAGVLTNARKTIDAGTAVAGLLTGGSTLRAWAHRNPGFCLRSTTYTHNASVLARLERFTAINSALAVDATGQVNAEVADGVYVGAVGGAADFLRAAACSRGGLPIIALPATARGRSRIVPRFAGPVSTARSDAGLVVTEHGVADLRGQPMSARIQRMAAIAAPEHREQFLREARRLLGRAGAVFINRT